MVLTYEWSQAFPLQERVTEGDITRVHCSKPVSFTMLLTGAEYDSDSFASVGTTCPCEAGITTLLGMSVESGIECSGLAMQDHMYPENTLTWTHGVLQQTAVHSLRASYSGAQSEGIIQLCTV